MSTPRPELTGPNAQIVDVLKAGCPGYAVMRSLMMGFRAVLKLSPPTATQTPVRTVTALRLPRVQVQCQIPVDGSRAD